MTLEEYQTKARATAIYPGQCQPAGLNYTILGLVGEAGELAQKLKKIYRDCGGAITAADQDAMSLELSDCLWYIAMTAFELGFNLNVIAEMNLKKLSDRKARNVIKGIGDYR